MAKTLFWSTLFLLVHLAPHCDKLTSQGHLANHTTRAIWIGDHQPIKHEFLQDFDASILKEIQSVFEDKTKLAHLLYTLLVPARYGVTKEDASEVSVRQRTK